MTFAQLFAKHGTRVLVNENDKVVHMEMTRCPNAQEIDDIWTVVATFITNWEHKRCNLHLQHVDTPDMEPPDLATMMHVLTKILDAPNMRKKLKRVIVQPRVVDDKVRLATTLFRGINPKLQLHVAADDDDIAKLLCA